MKARGWQWGVVGAGLLLAACGVKGPPRPVEAPPVAPAPTVPDAAACAAADGGEGCP